MTDFEIRKSLFHSVFSLYRTVQSLLTAKDNFAILYYIGGHLGRDKTYDKITRNFYWKHIWNDVKQFVKTCEVCQRTNDAKFLNKLCHFNPYL